MINKALLQKEVQRFILQNRKKDLPALVLKGSPFQHIEIQELAQQLKGKRIAEKKYPDFFNSEEVIYPPSLNLEQSSSQKTAEYKASLMHGHNFADLTGGFGIDTYFCSQQFETAVYLERNKELAEIAGHNFESFDKNIQVLSKDSMEYLKNAVEDFDWILIDPARRSSSGGKVFLLSDCEPNVPEHLDLILSKSKQILIKTSPILDIQQAISELKFVKEVHIVAVENEVKESLFMISKNYLEGPEIYTVNFQKKGNQHFKGNFQKNSAAQISYSPPLNFLYEPNSAIMKSGLLNTVAEEYNVPKLEANTHLYTSEELSEFPGRIFEIIDYNVFDSSYLKKKFKNKKANISTRNFPETVESIRKKYKIKDGGEEYLFFTTGPKNEKLIITCRKA